MSKHPWLGRALGRGIGWIAMLAPWLLPRRLCVAPALVVVMHPHAASRVHLLFLARNRIAGLDGPPKPTVAAIDAMLDKVAMFAHAHFTRPEEVVAVINGGTRQDVRVLHMHLLADAQLAAALREAESGCLTSGDHHWSTSHPLQPVHLMYIRSRIGPETLIVDVMTQVTAFGLAGYSLMMRGADPATVHLVGSLAPRRGLET